MRFWGLDSLRGFDWVYERFIANPVEGYDVFLSKPFENRHLLDQVPDYYERLKRSYDARFYQQEVLGEYLNLLSGQVYAAFDRSRNVEPVRIDPMLPLRWALDFNVDPMSSVVAQIAGGKVLVADEISLRRATTIDACEEFWRRYGTHAGGLIVYGDATGQRMQTSGATDYQMVGEFMRRHRGAGVPDGDRDVESGCERAGESGQREATECGGQSGAGGRSAVQGTDQRLRAGQL